MKLAHFPQYLKLSVQKCARRSLILPGMRAELKNRDFSIISSNCNGGVLTSDLGVRFNSPTVNLSMSPGDYLKLASNLAFYMNCEMREAPDTGCGCPAGILGDGIRVFFVHYRSFQEAREKWEARKARINYDNLFFMMTDRDGCTDKEVRRFDALPYKNKLIFTSKEYPEIPSAVWCSEFADLPEVPVLTEYRNLWGERLYDRYVDFVQWLNEGMKVREDE